MAEIQGFIQKFVANALQTQSISQRLNESLLLPGSHKAREFNQSNSIVLFMIRTPKIIHIHSL